MIRPTEIEAWELELPLRRPLITASQRIGVRHSTVIRVETADLEAWGEAAAYPGHTSDDSEDVWQLVSTEAKRLLGAADPVLIEGSAATSGVDQAMTALQAAAADQPLAVHLGGGLDPVLPSLAIPLAPAGETIRMVADAVEQRYRHVKLKTAPGHLAVVEQVRREFPDLGIAVDGNGSFRRPDWDDLAALDTLGLDYVEQPLAAANLQGHAGLQARMETPICLDESVRRLGDVVTIATSGAARAVSLKPGRLGPTLTLRALTLAVRHELDVKIGGLVETGVGKHTLTALAATDGVTLPSDLAVSAHFFDEDVVIPPWRLDPEGMMAPRRTLEVDRDLVDETAVRHHRFRR